MVGPSAYAYAPPPAPSAHYSQQYAVPQGQHLYPLPHASHAGQPQAHYYPSRGPAPIPHVHMPQAAGPVPQPPYVGGQPPRRSGPSSRRMTTS